MDVGQLRKAIDKAGSIRAAERMLRDEGVEISERTIRRRLQEDVADEYVVSSVPRRGIEELLEERVRKFKEARAENEAAKLRTVYLRNNQPIGIGFFGDPHLDDDGTDIERVMAHAALFDGTRKGLYGALLGDVTNNWGGRLERLYADQTTTAAEALRLMEHFVDLVKWLFIIGGNHEMMVANGRLLEQIAAAQSAVYSKHEQRVRLVFPNGREILIHARHKFPGSSMYMKQFGQVKAAFTGNADIYVGADKHVAGYSYGWNETQRKAWHAVQVASYKAIDDYPVELGLSPADLFQCPVAIIDPKAQSPMNLIRWEFDPAEGAERLAWMRSR